MPKSTLKPFYENLKQCTFQLERDVQDSLDRLFERIKSNDYELEKAKDYHYKEIVENLKSIKKSLDIIAEHNTQLDHLNTVRELSDDERKRYSYVQEKVKVFSRSECNLTRLHLKDSRKTLMGSQKYLNVWEDILKENDIGNVPSEEIFKVYQRNKENSVRKVKKFVSTTFEPFLEESQSTDSMIVISEDNTGDAEEEDNKLSHKSRNSNTAMNRRSLIENEEKINDCVNEYLSKTDIYETEYTAINRTSFIKNTISNTNCEEKDHSETNCDNVQTIDPLVVKLNEASINERINDLTENDSETTNIKPVGKDEETAINGIDESSINVTESNINCDDFKPKIVGFKMKDPFTSIP